MASEEGVRFSPATLHMKRMLRNKGAQLLPHTPVNTQTSNVARRRMFSSERVEIAGFLTQSGDSRESHSLCYVCTAEPAQTLKAHSHQHPFI